MIKNMKIKKSLILGFGVTIIVSLAIIIAVSYTHLTLPTIVGV